MKNFYIFVTCLIISIGISVVLVFSFNKVNLTYDDTVEYSASVTEIKEISNRNDTSIRIFIDEHLSYLLVSPRLTEKINYEIFNKIEINDTVVFRIDKKNDIHINSVEFLDIVYLATDAGVILSLDDYNSCTKESAKKTQIASIIFLILINSFFVYYITKCKRRH